MTFQRLSMRIDRMPSVFRDDNRWISRDPYGEQEEAINLYDYVGEDPINFGDVQGLEKGDFGDGDWEGSVSGSRSDTNPSVYMTYYASAQDQKCCKRMVMIRFVSGFFQGKGIIKADDLDGIGPESTTGVVTADEDQPGWYNILTKRPIKSWPFKSTFTWVVRCTSGCASVQGKALSEITQVYRLQNGQGTLSNQ